MALLGACDRAPAPVTGAATWTIVDEPLLRLAEDDVPAGHEFAGIVSARRLGDHRLIVANSGGLELAVFDSAGRFLRSIGRKGAGPGEFMGTLHVLAGPADSLAIYDGGNLRWTILTPALTVGRTLPTSDPDAPHPVWVYRGSLVTQPSVSGNSSWVLTVLDSLRARDPTVVQLIEARVDDTGALWVRDPHDPTTWDVYSGPGPASAKVQVPLELRLLQIGAEFVLGVVTDTLGVEAVVLHELRRSGAHTPPGETGSPLPSAGADSSLVVQLPHLIQAQEIFYSNYGRYTSDSDSLRVSFDPPARVFLLYGDQRHWAGVIVRPGSLATCGVAVGFPAPAGWDDGTPLCR